MTASIDAVHRLLCRLRMAICFHWRVTQVRLTALTDDNMIGYDYCNRCGKVTMKYYIG